MEKIGEHGDGSTQKKQSEKLQSIIRTRWHSSESSEVTGLLIKMQFIIKKRYYSGGLNASERMTLDLSVVLNQN